MLTGEEQRALEQARAATRARRKEASRARYFRRMRRIDPQFARGISKTADPIVQLQVHGSVVVSRGSIIVKRP